MGFSAENERELSQIPKFQTLCVAQGRGLAPTVTPIYADFFQRVSALFISDFQRPRAAREVVGERSTSSEVHDVSRNGTSGSENAGMSN